MHALLHSCYYQPNPNRFLSPIPSILRALGAAGITMAFVYSLGHFSEEFTPPPYPSI